MLLGNKALVLQFVKSPSSVNPSMTKQEDIYLQGEDRIYLNVRSSHRQSSHSTGILNSRKSSWKSSQHRLLFGGAENGGAQNQNETVSLASSGSKQWTTITIPHNYIGSSWPIRVSYIR